MLIIEPKHGEGIKRERAGKKIRKKTTKFVEEHSVTRLPEIPGSVGTMSVGSCRKTSDDIVICSPFESYAKANNLLRPADGGRSC